MSSNTAPDDVVMSRHPWHVNWYTEQPGVMIPYGDLAVVQEIARAYGVDLLLLGAPRDAVSQADCDAAARGAEPVGSRPALRGLYCGHAPAGLELIYQSPSAFKNRVVSYRLTSPGEIPDLATDTAQ
jgi:hypothetical protein